jgi:hypothetical protein
MGWVRNSKIPTKRIAAKGIACALVGAAAWLASGAPLNEFETEEHTAISTRGCISCQLFRVTKQVFAWELKGLAEHAVFAATLDQLKGYLASPRSDTHGKYIELCVTTARLEGHVVVALTQTSSWGVRIQPNKVAKIEVCITQLSKPKNLRTSEDVLIFRLRNWASSLQAESQ